MNVILPEKEKGTGKRKAIYIAILAVCTIAIGIAIYQFFADEKLEVILGIVQTEDEETEQLKAEFNNLFINRVLQLQNTYEISKINENEDLVYTEYSIEEKSENNYDLDVHIPCINIKSDITQKYNDEIKKSFKNPAIEIMQTKDRNIAYTVNYSATIENNILSLAILSTYKEGNNAQRTIVKTYNYDVKNNKQVNLNDYIQAKGIDKNSVETTIKKEIEKSQQEAEKLKELGYNIFSRDSKNSMYKLENTTEYFMNNGHLYIIYPYGNSNNTSEMDIVIIK